jgi:hypothetical protein
MKNIWNCIKNMFRVGVKSKDIDEQTIEVDYLGKKQAAVIYVPYGMQIKPPDGLLSLIWKQENNEDSLITMITDLENRDTDLEDKEVGYGIPTITTRLKFKANGDVEIFSEGEVIVNTQAGNKIETTSTGLNIEDLNGNTMVSSATGWNINNGNHEVLL